MNMEILMVQADVVWESPEENRVRFEKLIDKACEEDGKPNLIVLPEMFTTGFCMRPEGIAEQADTVSLQWMKAVAKKHNSAIAGSVAVKEGDEYFNRLYFVKPKGDFVFYDKRHLFTFSGEDDHYSAGKDRVVVEYLGFNILLQICYDLRFPVAQRNRGDYDVIINVASWPVQRVEAWKTLLKARAIENVAYMVGVNRVGEDPSNKYSGETTLIDFEGNVLAQAEDSEIDLLRASINKKSLEEFRKSFPALNDADQFMII